MGNTIERLLNSLLKPELIEILGVISELNSNELKGMLYFVQGIKCAKNLTLNSERGEK